MDQRTINMEARRQRILDSAERLIVRDTLSGFTMRALAQEVGLSVKTLYNLYGGKEAIAAILEDRAFSMIERSLTSLPDDVDPIEQVLTIMIVAAEECVKRKALILPMWNIEGDSPKGGPTRRSEFMDLGAGLAENALSKALDEGALRADFEPALLASQLTVVWFGTVLLWARSVLDDGQFMTRVKHVGVCNLLPFAEGNLFDELRAEIVLLEKQMKPLQNMQQGMKSAAT